MSHFTESVLEEAVLEYLGSLNWDILFGPEIAPGEPGAERGDYRDVLLTGRLRAALERLNPSLPAEAVEEAFRKVVNLPHLHPGLGANNRAFHKMLTDGVDVEYRHKDGHIAGDKALLVDFDHPERNEFLAVNQFTVIENGKNRRPDVVLFVNGLPLVVVELKNPADENADTHKAFHQIQTYKQEIPTLFAYNEIVVLSDGVDSRAGAFLSPWERFMPWRTVEGQQLAPASMPTIEVLMRGMFEKSRLLDLLHYFIAFAEEDGELKKKLAAYHQFHAVNAALEETLKATAPRGDRRIGVVWHTQGSGKSLTMAFYAGRVILHPKMENPTLVVLTDRNDLDDQLFETFVQSQELIRQTPVQAEDRAHLRDLLRVAAGGVSFTTLQKFLPEGRGDRFPLLSERSNIVVIADEAHRSQYGFIKGFARHLRDALPNASFIGFTATPIELGDRNTRQVFGEDISIYDVERAIKDKVTVPILYEARLAKIDLKDSERPHLDKDFEEVTEGEESFVREQLKNRWSRLEAMVGAEKRLRLLARDIVDHFEARQQALDGKGMIVAMSRRIAVDLYNEIIRLRPAWHDPDDAKGALKVVMTGSASDSEGWQPHIRNKERRKDIEKRFKDASDPLKLVIVRDMWLTGFDAPCLHTMYADKPMRGHGLMQAIARVNRVFRDKPGGLVVDYLGLADQLKHALSIYTESGGQGSPSIDNAQAIAMMQEKHEVACAIMHGFSWDKWTTGTSAERLGLIPAGQEHVLQQEDGKQRFVQVVTDLSRVFALCAATDEAIELRDDIAFFQAIKAQLVKSSGTQRPPEEIDAAVRQLVSKAIMAEEGIIDVFTAAGLKKPDISILSDQFLAEVRGLKHKNVAAELLAKLLKDEIKKRSLRNLVQSRAFSEMLKSTLNAYQNRAIATQEVIEELIKLAKEMDAATKRGENLGLNEDEIAFYDALAANESAVLAMGNDELKVIAAELVTQVRKSVTIDWAVRESARARIKVMVKRILKKHGFPPDLQEEATKTVLAQAELLSALWAA